MGVVVEVGMVERESGVRHRVGQGWWVSKKGRGRRGVKGPGVW